MLTRSLVQIITGVAFTQDWLTSVTQTVCWSIIFFFSSAGSSSAYLTIAEVLCHDRLCFACFLG